MMNGDEYTARKPKSFIHNLFLGTIYVEHAGKIVCEKVRENGKDVEEEGRLRLELELKK